MTADTVFPDQPLCLDEDEVVRFVANRIVRYLLDSGGINLNHLDKIGYCFTLPEWEQFYQLIGRSVSTFGDLNRVSPETVARVDAQVEAFIQVSKPFTDPPDFKPLYPDCPGGD